MFEYNAKLIRIVDGDTVDAMVDLGFSTWKKIRVRLYGINTPECRTRDKEEKKKGLAAKARLTDLLEMADNEFKLKSHGVGKFGRCLGELFIENADISLQQILINEGHGVAYFGGSR